MFVRASDGLRWAAVWAFLATVGCPQVAKDDFAVLSPNAPGGATQNDSDGGMLTGGELCGTGVGAGGLCGAGSGGISGENGGSASATMPDASQPAPPDAGPDCGPDGARGPNGDCYYVDSTATTWSTARLACGLRGTGWDLAKIRSSEDNAFLTGLIDFEAWLGATDATTEGAWLWLGDEMPFFDAAVPDAGAVFTSWNAGEPNNNDNSDCLRLLPTGLWADWECTSLKGRVCQRPNP